MSFLDELYTGVKQHINALPIMQQLNEKPAMKEFYSWLSPAHVSTASLPQIGGRAPSSGQLSLPCGDGRPAIVVFLRHCGCPFAENTMRTLRALADRNSHIHMIAVSHSSPAETSRWLSEVGGAGAVSVIVDHERQLYASWGLGASGLWHVLNPWSLWSVYTLGKRTGIWNRQTETGNRWVQGGQWAVDGQGRVIWGGPSDSASEEADWQAAIRLLE